MKFEKEITVEVDLSYSDLKKILTQNNFIIKEEYEINDIYMLDGKYEISSDYLDTLKHCVLLRNIIEKKAPCLPQVSTNNAVNPNNIT